MQTVSAEGDTSPGQTPCLPEPVPVQRERNPAGSEEQNFGAPAVELQRQKHSTVSGLLTGVRGTPCGCHQGWESHGLHPGRSHGKVARETPAQSPHPALCSEAHAGAREPSGHPACRPPFTEPPAEGKENHFIPGIEHTCLPFFLNFCWSGEEAGGMRDPRDQTCLSSGLPRSPAKPDRRDKGWAERGGRHRGVTGAQGKWQVAAHGGHWAHPRGPRAACRRLQCATVEGISVTQAVGEGAPPQHPPAPSAMSYNTQQRRGWGRAGAACFANRLFSINFPLETLRKNSLTPPRTTPPTAQKGAREPRPQAERRLPTASSSGPRLLVSQAPARPTARRAREIRLRSPAVRPQSPDTAQRPGPQGPGGAFPKAQQKLVQPEGRSPRREGAHEGKVSASTARLRPPLRGGTGVCGPLPAAWPHNREAAPFLSPSPQHDPPLPPLPRAQRSPRGQTGATWSPQCPQG